MKLYLLDRASAEGMEVGAEEYALPSDLIELRPGDHMEISENCYVDIDVFRYCTISFRPRLVTPVRVARSK